ncbi:MarR family transcriptional regulator [Bradyrhizobium sp. SZCCHNRI2049]|uniref:MarR family transcriptional regulator n=1 Tax=Bradyrhizobium sp. SZCCHNRI2049 TaxID=3057287 RepID=UPI002916BB12|nr:MarR family transcriptional regulator [Bradyrhizobium sp. SZCCHNRI2049]
MSIHQFTRALDLVSDKTSGECSLLTLRTFLFVAKRGKCTQKDVELELKISNAAASRNVSWWTDRRYDRQQGMNFIERVEQDADRRFKELTLTAQGKKFYAELLEVMKG